MKAKFSFAEVLQVGEGRGCCVAKKKKLEIAHSNIFVPRTFLINHFFADVIQAMCHLQQVLSTLRERKARQCVRQHKPILGNSHFEKFPLIVSKPSLSSETSLTPLHLFPGAMSLCYLSWSFKYMNTT